MAEKLSGISWNVSRFTNRRGNTCQFSWQVLPERTHPEVMMSGGGGYILSGIYVDNTEVPKSEEDNSSNGRNKKVKRFRRR